MTSVAHTVQISFSCNPNDIVYINSVIDSYGGLGLIRTVNSKYCRCILYSTDTVYKTGLEVLNALIDEGVSVTDIKVIACEDVGFDIY